MSPEMRNMGRNVVMQELASGTVGMVNRNNCEGLLNSSAAEVVSQNEPRYKRLVNTIAKFFLGVCHYAQCDRLRHLPGQVTPSREVV